MRPTRVSTFENWWRGFDKIVWQKTIGPVHNVSFNVCFYTVAPPYCNKVNVWSRYLALENVDLAITDVQMIAHFVHFSRESVTLLSGLQSNLSLFLNDPILFFVSLSQFFHLDTQKQMAGRSFNQRPFEYSWKNGNTQNDVRLSGACCSAPPWRKDSPSRRLYDAGNLDVVPRASSFWPPLPAVLGPVYQFPSAALQSEYVRRRPLFSNIHGLGCIDSERECLFGR